MNNLKESFLKKYGVAEYVLFVFGAAMAGRATYSMIFLNFKETSWLEIAFITSTFLLGVLAFAAPKYLIDLAKKKSGRTVSEEDSENK